MCLRPSTCDQLLILDCSFAGKAFSHEVMGRRKFELLASCAHDQLFKARGFTKELSESMHHLLKSSPDGFSTSELYRELYHRTPYGSRPLHFDQSARGYGKIWLHPQRLQPKAQTLRNRVFMNVTFALDEYPDGGATNEIARALRTLPHVSQIRFEKIYDPRATLTRVVRLVVWMQRWCRKTRKRSRTARQSRMWTRRPADFYIHENMALRQRASESGEDGENR